MKRFKLGLIALAVTSAGAMADVGVDQGGSGNLATVTQTGNGSNISVNQYGLGGNVSVNQVGDGNNINVFQGDFAVTTAPIVTTVDQTDATNSNIDVNMDGIDDVISVTTSFTTDSWVSVGSGEGANNSIAVNQSNANFSGLSIGSSGSNNTWDVTQSGTNNNIDVFSTNEGTTSIGNLVVLDQSGNDNFARTHLTGSDNDINVVQSGDRLSVDMGVFGYDSTLPNPDPEGCPDCVGQVSGESSRNFIDVDQYGVDQRVEIYITPDGGSFDNQLTLVQDGELNLIRVGASEGSSGNFVTVTQTAEAFDTGVQIDMGGTNNIVDITQSDSFSGLWYNSAGSGNVFNATLQGVNQFHNISQTGMNNTASVTVNAVPAI